MRQVDVVLPNILISFPDYSPDEFIAEVLGDFALPESMIEVRKVERHAYAALEWTIPTVIAVYLGKTVFEAFLKEAAKEYTPNLLTGLKSLARRCQQLRSRFITSTDSTHKHNENYQQSSAFSLIVETKTGHRIKLLFDVELSPAEWEDAIDGILGTVAANYINAPEDSLSKSVVVQATKTTSPLYIIYNREHKKWEMHNDQTMLALARASKGK